MKIYDQEKSIEEQIQTNRVSSAISAMFKNPDVSVDSLVSTCQGEACSCENIKAIASESSADTMPISSILVTDIWNANNDVFCFEEMLKARETPRFKPINWMHRGSEDTKNETIGVMVETGLVRGGLDSLRYFSESEIENYSQSSNYTISGDMHIRQDGIIWSQYFPTYAKKVKKGIEDGSLFVSMECFFDDFDYVLRDDESSSDYVVVKRSAATADMSKSLKQYGGKGTVKYKGKEYQVGRLLKNITFSGQGVVKDPANKKDGKVLSIILNDIKEKAESQIPGVPEMPQVPAGDPAAMPEGVPPMPAAPEAAPEEAPQKDLPTTYLAPDKYLYNTAEEAAWVGENELGCTGYHVYLEDRHSKEPLLTAALLGDPTPMDKQSMRPKFLPCEKHAEFLLLTKEKEGDGDLDSMLGGGGGSPSSSDPLSENVSIAPVDGRPVGVGLGGVVISAEGWDNLKDNLITLSDKLSAKEKSGYKDKEVNNMPEQENHDSEIDATSKALIEMTELNSSLQEQLLEATAAIESAAEFIENNKVDSDRLAELEAFAAEADQIISDIELEKLGEERLALMTELVGDAYAEKDASELASMDESTFAHVYETMTKVVEKIESAAAQAELAKIKEAEEVEVTEDEIKNSLAGIVSQLDSSEEPDLVVKASQNDPRNAARNLIRNAIQR